MSLKRLALVLPLTLALVVAAPALGWADDEAPAPKKIRVKLGKGPKAGKAEAHKSPMTAIHKWLAQQMGADGPATDHGAMLKSWFEGGSDVPMAGLRDALKAEGWNADTLGAWMGSQAAKAVPGLMQMLSSMGPMFRQGHGRTFGAGQGCPHCGHGSSSTRGGMHGGMHGFPGGMRGFPGGMRGFPGGMRGMRGGMHGFPGGMRGGMRGGRHGFPGGMGPQARTHSQSRAYIMWNDGSGWQRRELPGGMQGFMGTPRSSTTFRGMPGMPGGQAFGRMGPPPQGRGDQAGPQGVDVIQLLLKQFMNAGKDDAPNESLRKIYELLEKQGAGLTPEEKRAGIVDALPWKEFVGPDGKTKMRVKIAAPKKVEIIRESEEKKLEPKR